MEFESSSSTSGRPVDLHAICRLCLSDRKDSLKSIYDEVLGPNRVPQKIELLIQIQISKHDRLSTMVCNDCIIRLDTWFSYKRQCHRNQTKLAEWLNITKTAGSELNETTLHIKQEPIDPPQHGYLPVKVELNHDDEEYDDMNVSGYHTLSNDQLYLEDLDINALETDDDRRCPDCGKMFGSAQNRRRHQNMMHAKKERRAQMMEIRSPLNRGQSHSQNMFNVKSETQENQSETKHGPNNSSDIIESDSTSHPKNDSNPADQQENSEKDSRETDDQNNDPHASDEKAENMDTSDTQPTEDMETEEKISDKNLPVKEEPVETNNDETSQTGEKGNEENREENRDIDSQEDEKKIQFAAGLQLVQKDQASIELESLSKIELSYIEKCKAMVSMFHTLQCACHNVQHKTLRYLLSHLRETRIWFPLFTCYNCMISLTDRSTFTRHHSRCPKPQLETLIKLSNLRKRSEVKSRLYQNFKCNRCKFLYSFHEDFCKHIDEDHAYGSPPFYCSCRYVFDSLEEYKTHCYTSCILSYYCDICFVTTSTLEEFIKHSEEAHDNSEGFILLQENSYVPRNHTYRHKEADDESNVLEGKRERRKSVKEPIMVQIYDREIPPDLKEIPTKVIKKILQLDKVPASSDTCNRTGAQCPLCKKQYSSVNNMMRHYRTHIERKEIELPKFEDETGTGNEDLYTCPDCGGVYPSSKWSSHLEEKHPTKSCSECEKEFQFQSELDQHRSVHLNLKVFRDSKTQAYRSTMVSPTSESNGLDDEVIVSCEICDAMFNSKAELRHHKLIEHDSTSRSEASDGMDNMDMSADDEPLLDVEGYEEVNEKDDGNENATSQSPAVEKPYCEYCDKPFASAKSLREHVINKHGAEYLKKSEYPKQCELCDRVLSTGSGFKLHMQMHNRIKSENEKSEFPKKCEYCDKVCTTGAALYVHTQMHERVTLGELKRKKEDKKKSESSQPQDEDESYHTCKRCFKVFGTRGKLKEHMKCHGFSNKSSPKKNRKVLCDLCHVAVENHDALAKHKAEEHSDELDGMPSIKTEMDVDEDSQNTNSTDNTPSIIYACDICEKTFSSKPELRAHKESHSQPKSRNTSLTCKYCRITFESINGLTKHMHTEHDESAKPKTAKESKYKVDDGSDKPYKCPICKKGFATLGAMTTHSGWHKRGINKGASQNTPQAEAAVKLAKKEKVLKKISAAISCKQEPIDAPEFQCSTCFMELPNETALQIHVLEKHGSLEAFMLVPRCNTCNQDFKSQEEYETHKRFHDFLERQKRQEQQMQTPVIQSVQSVSDQTQSTPKKFPCSWCTSVFSRQDTLNTHIKNHHKEHVKTEFECPECNRIFDKQNSLTIHLKTHQKQKAASAQASNVNHAIVGGIGKVYVCSLCNMGFSFPKDLRMHTINAHPF